MFNRRLNNRQLNNDLTTQFVKTTTENDILTMNTVTWIRLAATVITPID